MGIRVIKTAIAVVIAISLAGAFHLNYVLGAGILAILGTDVTIRKSLRSVSIRILASILGLCLASLIFYVLGFQLWTLGLYILIAYPILARVKLADGIVTSSVVVFHLVDKHEVTLRILGNEILLLFIGLGTASVVNLVYMPSAEKTLAELRHKTDSLFSDIFLHIAKQLREPSTVWDGKELLEAPDTIREGTALARRAAENKLFQTQDSWIPYFDMRRQHYESIQRMIDLVAQVYQTLPHGEAVANLFTGLSESVKSEYYGGAVEASLLRLEQEFKEMPLPATREEFEMRSAILQLNLELKTYLKMAKKVKKSKANA